MTRILSGVTVPNEMYLEGKAHQAGGGTALLGLFGVYPDCANCGGAKQIGLVLLTGEGQKFLLSKGASHFYNGLWYKSSLIAWPCPICQSGSHQDIIESCLEGSGLARSEYDWRVSFAAGLPGKNNAVDAVNAMLADTARPLGWIFLYGDNGLGKTGLLVAAVAAMCRIGISAHYTTAAGILNETYDLIQRSRRGDDEAESMKEFINRYARYQLLAVDELGTDRVADTNFAQSALFGVLDARYTARGRLATLLASNQAPQAMAVDVRWRYFESRTQDGLRISVGGKSFRGKTPPDKMPVPYKD